MTVHTRVNIFYINQDEAQTCQANQNEAQTCQANQDEAQTCQARVMDAIAALTSERMFFSRPETLPATPPTALPKPPKPPKSARPVALTLQ